MTTDVEERPPAEPEPSAAREHPASDEIRQRIRTRLVLPLLIPLGAAAALAVLAFNLSRVFLAGGKLGALIAATLVTLAVLGGAAWLSAKPELRSSSLTLISAIVVLLVVAAGLTTLGAADEHDDEAAVGFVEPEGEPGAAIETMAMGSLSFSPSELTAPAGIIEIELTQEPGAGFHTFTFDGAFEGFELTTDGPFTGRIEAEEAEYVFYCTVPGHRAAGMEGVLTVTAAENGAPAEGAADDDTGD